MELSDFILQETRHFGIGKYFSSILMAQGMPKRKFLSLRKKKSFCSIFTSPCTADDRRPTYCGIEIREYGVLLPFPFTDTLWYAKIRGTYDIVKDKLMVDIMDVNIEDYWTRSFIYSKYMTGNYILWRVFALNHTFNNMNELNSRIIPALKSGAPFNQMIC